MLAMKRPIESATDDELKSMWDSWDYYLEKDESECNLEFYYVDIHMVFDCLGILEQNYGK
jgi:hypothetical protein